MNMQTQFGYPNGLNMVQSQYHGAPNQFGNFMQYPGGYGAPQQQFSNHQMQSKMAPGKAPQSGQSLGASIKDVDWSKERLKPIKKIFFKATQQYKDRDPSKVQQYLNENQIMNRNKEIRIPAPFLEFSDADFPSYIQQAIEKIGFPKPTPIQSQSWPVLLDGNDLIGIAQTGSGKTLAYVLPAIIHLRGQEIQQSYDPQVLILAPTRELAVQIEQQCKRFGCSQSVVVYGGTDKYQQKAELKKGCQILIATPGRLIDFMESGSITLKKITFLVLDEADRMLDMGFGVQIRKIISQCRPDRQTCMTSATWPKEVQKIADEYLDKSVHIQIGDLDYSANQNITQIVEMIPEYQKRQRLGEILKYIKKDVKMIIFCQTKKGCEQLDKDLKFSIRCISIHGDKSQKERDYALQQFKEGKFNCLVATDVAARGLDVKDVRYVINYDFPMTIQDYVHRIGRTGRGGAFGIAYTLLSESNERVATDLVNTLDESNQQVPQELREISQNSGNNKRKNFGGSSLIFEQCILKYAQSNLDDLIKMSEKISSHTQTTNDQSKYDNEVKKDGSSRSDYRDFRKDRDSVPDYNKGGDSRSNHNSDYNRGERSDQNRDFNRGGSDYNRGGSDYNRGASDYNRGGSDYNRGSSNHYRGGQDYNKGGSDYNQGGKDYNKDHRDSRQDHRDSRLDHYKTDNRDSSNYRGNSRSNYRGSDHQGSDNRGNYQQRDQDKYSSKKDTRFSRDYEKPSNRYEEQNQKYDNKFKPIQHSQENYGFQLQAIPFSQYSASQSMQFQNAEQSKDYQQQYSEFQQKVQGDLLSMINHTSENLVKSQDNQIPSMDLYIQQYMMEQQQQQNIQVSEIHDQTQNIQVQSQNFENTSLFDNQFQQQ